MLQPLKGTRILEMGDGIPSAFATRVLSDLGAEVIRLEQLCGGRPKAGSFDALAPRGSRDAFFGYLNHGKRRVSIDLNKAEGADLARRLAEQCDVIVLDGDSTVTAGGFNPVDDNWPKRPSVVSLTFYGLSGERADTPGHPFVIEHAGGFAFHQASPVEDPSKTPPLHCADFESSLAVGLVGANAALSALIAGNGSRPGRVLDISSEDVLVYLLVEAFAFWKDGANVTNRERVADQRITVAGGLIWLLECADGAIMVSPREDHQWQRWVQVMGNPAWANDAKLCGDRFIRRDNALKLSERMTSWSRHQNTHDVFIAAQESRVACYPISTAKDLLGNEQLHERGFFDTLRLADGTELPVPGLPFQMTSQSGEMLRRAGKVTPGDSEDVSGARWKETECVAAGHGAVS